MTRLSNIVGGLMRDLAQSHSISDAYTMETLDVYRRDAVLSQFPVPRMAIREVQVKLRFAVGAVQDPVVEPDPAELQELWLKTMRERVVPRSLADVGRIDNKRVVAAFEKRLASAGATTAVDPDSILLDGREDDLVKATLSFLQAQVDSLPASTRASVDNTDLTGAFERIARSEMQELRRAARQLEQARLAAQTDLDLLVTTDSLASLPESQISELAVTVSMEEVQFGNVPTLPGDGG